MPWILLQVLRFVVVWSSWVKNASAPKPSCKILLIGLFLLAWQQCRASMIWIQNYSKHKRKDDRNGHLSRISWNLCSSNQTARLSHWLGSTKFNLQCCCVTFFMIVIYCLLLYQGIYYIVHLKSENMWSKENGCVSSRTACFGWDWCSLSFAAPLPRATTKWRASQSTGLVGNSSWLQQISLNTLPSPALRELLVVNAIETEMICFSNPLCACVPRHGGKCLCLCQTNLRAILQQNFDWTSHAPCHLARLWFWQCSAWSVMSAWNYLLI